MSLDNLNTLITQVGTVVDAIEQTITDDDSILAQVATEIQALVKNQGSVDTTTQETALASILSKIQDAQTKLGAEKKALQDAVTAAAPGTQPAA